MATSEPRFPALFDPKAWEADLARSTATGREAGEAAQRDYEANGIPRSHLRPCEGEGRDGTMLPDYKVRVPHPDGKWGIVFKSIILDGRPTMELVGFGARHHPKIAHALNVYELASRRLTEIAAHDLREDPA